MERLRVMSDNQVAALERTVYIPDVEAHDGYEWAGPAREGGYRSSMGVPLIAAGEVAGGIHGENRLMGNSLLDIIVFGRIAGTTASHFIQDQVKDGKLTELRRALGQGLLGRRQRVV